MSDFEVIEREVSEKRRKLKVGVNKLRDAENKEPVKGFNLKPLSEAELRLLRAEFWWILLFSI